MAARKNAQYRPGELEVILSLAPSATNIHWLSVLLERSEAAIRIVYKTAYEHGPFGENADIQEKKVIAAKESVGIAIGRKQPRSERRPGKKLAALKPVQLAKDRKRSPAARRADPQV